MSMRVVSQQTNLVKRLRKQAEIMQENAELMEILFPDIPHTSELFGGADISRQWADSLEAGKWGGDNEL